MPADLPFAPGESPFRAKGTAYQGLLASADARVPGGSKAVLAAIDDRAMLEFFEQRFLAASTYDVFPIVPFGMAGARVVGMTYPEYVRAGAAFQAKRDMHGIYKVLLKFASPSSVVQRLPRVLVQYFNFGSIEGRFVGERKYEATARGIPKPLIVWLINIAQGFIPVVMGQAGAKDTGVRIHAPQPDGVEHGIELVRAAFTISWS